MLCHFSYTGPFVRALKKAKHFTRKWEKLWNAQDDSFQFYQVTQLFQISLHYHYFCGFVCLKLYLTNSVTSVSPKPAGKDRGRVHNK